MVPLPAEPLGSSQLIGNHCVICNNCLPALRSLADQSVDVIVTSPPYNLQIPYRSYQDDLSEADYIQWFIRVAEQLLRILRPDGSFFLNVAGSGSQPWLPFELAIRLRQAGFILQNHIVWVKSITTEMVSRGHFKPVGGRRFLHHNHEHLFHLTNDGRVKLDRLAIGIPYQDKSNIRRRGHSRDIRCRGNTWFIPYKTVQSRAEKFDHPTPFPVELPMWCIWLHGKSNPTVLDPFVGTGTTLLAAHDSGGRGIGIDIDATYVRAALNRLKRHIGTSMRITLSHDEMAELLRQDPSTREKGGFQGLLIRLQDRLNKISGQVSLTEEDMRRIHRYAFGFKSGGGWQRRLVTIFSRHLGPRLDRSPKA
ncbi:MAG: site-specific DNA-methyltransferase [Acidisphaera sp.]|nr:site-specific DNA-methyltransferase [Acidisphaera sp.]